MIVSMDSKFVKGVILGIAIGLSTAAGLIQLRKFLQSRKTKDRLQENGFDQKYQDDNEVQEILGEQLVRNYQFFGEAGQKLVESSHIVIFGIGGVGSHVLSALARSGVSKIVIIDFDRVTLSSLNRHAFATREHVGRSKVEIFKKFLMDINPRIDLTTFDEYVTVDNVPKFFQDGKPDFAIDCIDNLDAKAALVAYCVKNKIKVISSCGAGMKSDPTRIQIRDISESSYDDLARALRRRLQKYKIHSGVTVVFSSELTERELLPLKQHQEEKVEDYKTFSNQRLRIVPVIGTMPASFGYFISSFVLCQLAKQPYKPYSIDDVKQGNYARLYTIIINQAKKAGIHFDDIQVDLSDMYVVVRDVHEWKCLVCEKWSTNLELVRWDPNIGFQIRNLVPMFGPCMEKHKEVKHISQIKDFYSAEVIEKQREKLKLLDEILEKKTIIFK